MVRILDYMNYREYLRDFFKEKKREVRFYSYRLFSLKAGLKSPNFLKLVIKDERNLSKQSVYKFSKALNLSKMETDYFENLVFFNQSKTPDEKDFFLSRITEYLARYDPRKAGKTGYDGCSLWNKPVIRELIGTTDLKDDLLSTNAASQA
jgi:uncharacterized protein (TIGR02147 family)